jgi:hypothetical protein
MTCVDIRLFWIPLSTMKWRGVPFTHICEWNRFSLSSGSYSSSGWTFLVAMVTLCSASMIRFPLFGSKSNSKLAYESKAFVSANDDCLE